ncbi:MAG: TolC family protein [Phycisphaeraceae bacterium]|nr:TolC family protein [Phycisphaeraceae bacterium]
MRSSTSRLGMILAGGLLLSAGCQRNQPFDEWISGDRSAHSLGSVVEAREDAGGPGHPSSSRVDQPPWTDRKPTLDDLLARAITANPQVEAAHLRIEQLQERIAQAGAPPNPMARVGFGQMDMDFTVGLEQRLPFPGTLHARREVARQEVQQARHQLEALIDRIEGDVRRSYWAYIGISAQIEILQRNRRLLERIEETVRARMRIGDATQGDLLRVSRRISQLENRIDELQSRRATALAMLRRATQLPTLEEIAMPRSPGADTANSLDLPPGEVEDRAAAEFGRLTWSPIHLDARALAELAGHQSPMVRSAQAEAETYHRRLTLARRERMPELMFGVQYGRVGAGGNGMASQEDEIMGMVGMSIPIWVGRDDAREREALRGVGRAGAQAQAARDELRFKVEEAIARLEFNQSMLRRLERRMIPDAERIIDLAMASYRTGDITLLQLLDDWERLLDDQADRVRIIADMHRAVADLTQALGGPLPDFQPGEPQ